MTGVSNFKNTSLCATIAIVSPEVIEETAVNANVMLPGVRCRPPAVAAVDVGVANAPLEHVSVVGQSVA
jgi:hypothetical protein